MRLPRVRFIRSNFLPILFVDIEPGVLHTYRLELYGAESYIWSIDGQVIDSGIPQGSFLDNDPRLIWGAQRFGFDHSTRWHYIRYQPVEKVLDRPGRMIGLDGNRWMTHG